MSQEFQLEIIETATGEVKQSYIGNRFEVLKYLDRGVLDDLTERFEVRVNVFNPKEVLV